MSKDEEIRNVAVRRKNILFLMQRYLLEAGFCNAAEALRTEARLPDDYELCDNVDLDAIYLEYASYHQLKFGKYPRILRKVNPAVKLELASKRKKTRPLPSQTTTKETPSSEAAPTFECHDLQVTVKRLETDRADEQTCEPNENLLRLQHIEHAGAGIGGGDQLLSNPEWQSLTELVRSTILREDLKLGWGDMLGNNDALDVIKEAVLAPLKFPQLFANGLRPWRSLLLHGPPGSGKTMLAKILYAETRQQVTFFNVTSSVIVSKWRGESEKILRILFQLAQRHAPAIVFLDEIEGLTSKRDRPSDHESSKRFKNELLQLLDGMEQNGVGVFILASTNLPWDIDDAFLRRFEKKMLVQLPNAVERARLIDKLLPITVNVTQPQMEALVRQSEHFTGDEIRLACKEIAMQAVRRVTRGKEAVDVPLERAFESIKPLSLKLMRKHVQWQRENGT